MADKTWYDKNDMPVFDLRWQLAQDKKTEEQIERNRIRHKKLADKFKARQDKIAEAEKIIADSKAECNENTIQD